MSTMVRKQIYLTAAQDRRLRREALRQRRAEAEIIREALDRQLGEDTAGHDVSSDSLWDIIGIARSGRGDLSTNVDHYLYGAPKTRK